MKNLLTLAIVLTSATAFATRARVTALGNSPHIIDTALSAPDQVFPLADSLTIESGSTAPTGTIKDLAPATTINNTISTNAEGSMYKTMGDGKLGFVLGHQDAIIYNLRKIAANAAGMGGIDAQQNPFNVNYSMRMSDMNAGFGLIYSNYADKTLTNDEKETSMGLQAGVSTSMFYANAKLILTDSYKTATNEYKGKPGFDLKAGYYMGDLSVHGNIMSTGFKTSSTTADTSDVEMMTMKVKLVDTIKKESNFFYGVGLQSTTAKEKLSSSKMDVMALPFIIGLETPATSWMTFRGSITQDVIISNSKTEGAVFTPAGEFAPGVNTTTFAAGLGLTFNKVTIDGSILAGGTQTVNAGNLLGTVGLAYNF